MRNESGAAKTRALAATVLAIVPGTVLATQVASPGFAAHAPEAPRAHAASTKLLVSTPASLTEAYADLAQAFEARNPGIDVDLNTGASGVLANQIEQGAPADVFASADQARMDKLESKALLEPGTRRNFARNAVVLAVPRSGVRTLTWKSLPGHPGIRRVAIGDEGVPAGTYARQVLEKLGIMDGLRPKLVMGADVRQVLAYLTQGEVDAGVVYETDVRASKGQVWLAARAPAGSHDPIVYPIAVIAASRDKLAARRFVDLVAGPTGQAIFTKRGFLPLEAGK